MRGQLLVLLLLLSAVTADGPPERQALGERAEKAVRSYRRQARRVARHHKMLTERNLQQIRRQRFRFLPTNITSIRRIRIPGRLSGARVRGFLDRVAGGRISPRFIRNRLLNVRMPLFNRFRLRRRLPSQMRCSLQMRVEGMQNFFRIGVVLVRLTFFSSCMSSRFTKFIWVNSFDSTSHFRLRIGRQSYLMLFGNTIPRRSPFNNLMHYDSYKLLNLFRARTFSGRGRGRGRGVRRRGRVRRRGGAGRRRGRGRRRSRAVMRPRKLAGLEEPKAVAPEERKLADGDNPVAVTEQKEEKKPDRELQRRRRRQRRRRGRRRRRNFFRFFRRRRRRQRRRQVRRRVRRQPVRRWRPRPVIRRAPPPAPRPIQRPAARPRPSSPIGFSRTVINLEQGTAPDTQRNLHRSFQHLVRRNKEDRVAFLRAVREPVNLLPRVEWRPINRRREILSAGSASRPFWSFQVIRRIWRGQNPQIAPARPIPSLKDAIITVSI